VVIRVDGAAIAVAGYFTTRPMGRSAIIAMMRRHRLAAFPVRRSLRRHHLVTMRGIAHATAASRHARRKRSRDHPHN